MRARSLELGQFDGARHGISEAVVGIGEPLSRVPSSLSQAILIASEEHGGKAGRMLLRFAELPPDTLVWTQTDAEEFRLGRISGGWFYDASPAAEETGIVNVRPVRWRDRRFGLEETPGAVLDSFARGGRNLQRINAPGSGRETELLWEPGAPPDAAR